MENDNKIIEDLDYVDTDYIQKRSHLSYNQALELKNYLNHSLQYVKDRDIIIGSMNFDNAYSDYMLDKFGLGEELNSFTEDDYDEFLRKNYIDKENSILVDMSDKSHSWNNSNYIFMNNDKVYCYDSTNDEFLRFNESIDEMIKIYDELEEKGFIKFLNDNDIHIIGDFRNLKNQDYDPILFGDNIEDISFVDYIYQYSGDFMPKLDMEEN